MRQKALWQELAERETADEGNDDPRDRNRYCDLADLAYQPEVSLHASQQQQQEDAELGDAVEQGLLLRRGREDRLLRLGPHAAEQGGRKQQAAEELAHNRRLSDALHHFPKPAAYGNQQGDLDKQQEFGRTRGLLACSIRNRDHR